MEVESSNNIAKWNGRVPPLDLSGVSVCPRETERRWSKMQQHNHSSKHYEHRQHTQNHNQHHKIGTDGLPIDPRDWTRSDVWQWLTNLAQSEGLQPSPELAHKFPMNGKALCLMSLDMYLARVPHGGKMLYRDFRVRLARAMSL